MAAEYPSGSYQEETELNLLHVKVIRASNIPWADWMSNADCYVELRLPTCKNERFRTKTAANTSKPEWNESFTFQICSNIQNIIQISLQDEDSVSKNDLLYTIFFDVGKIPPGQKLQRTFSLKPEGIETLEMEFRVEKIAAKPEKLLTNKVLVSREMCCLDVCIDKQKIPDNLKGKDLILEMEDSCEKHHKVLLNANTGPNHEHVHCFHYIKKWDPDLTVKLEGAGLNKDDYDGLLTVPVKTFSFGKEEKVEFHSNQVKPLELKVKANECTHNLDVRLGFDLCEEEKIFLTKRKQVAAAALKKVLKLDRDLQDHEIPTIAVTTTGGGTRAMTSLYGTLSGLKKLNLLDCVSYITGASGSTWAISKLYEDSDWSQKDLTEPIEDARRNVTKSKSCAFTIDKLRFYREEMNKRAEQGYRTSFTDIWGLVIESMFHDDVNETKLSDQKKALSDGQNPLPICLAMNVKNIKHTTLDFKEWCEFSPYEVGLLKYGAYIRSEDFGSKFYMGRLTKKLPESRICYLQGLWSNVFSVNLVDAWYAATSSENFWTRFTKDEIHDLDGEEAIMRRRNSFKLPTLNLQPKNMFKEIIQKIITNRPLDGEHHNFLSGLQFHKDYHKQTGFSLFEDTELDKLPNQLTPFTDELCLVDIAYYINASFPSLLRKERKVDVILSFDYGLSEKFKSVEETHKYCCDQNIPFPKIELNKEEEVEPKECYIFKESDDPEAPTILHFPLVNNTFKNHTAPGVKRSPEELEGGIVDLTGMWSPYSLLKLAYSEENFDKLLNLTEYNVLNNETIILQALREAVVRKQNASSPN
ncbi:cytosolic phospholipase A2 delta-like [Bombina bombina]|uniref:cytosolic phospholipase A2 delta-like n=1 Tax=Bombina bombina TaxID=8345 RepID=UPI00235ADA3D|nr:cytosolic phospholipase A2 delta-like [Bombina bombina]